VIHINKQFKKKLEKKYLDIKKKKNDLILNFNK